MATNIEQQKQQQPEAREAQTDLQPKLDELQGRIASWQSLLEYAEKGLNDRLATLDTITTLTSEEREEKKTAQRDEFEKTKAEYLAKIAGFQQEIANLKQDTQTVEGRDKPVLEANQERVETASDTVMLENTVARILHSYPQWKEKLPATEGKLAALEQTVDTIQRSLQDKKQVQAETGLLDKYKEALQQILEVLENMPATDAKTTEQGIADAISKKVDEQVKNLQANYKDAFGGTKGTDGQISPRDAAARISQVYAQGDKQNQKAGIANEIANMRVALVNESLGRQQNVMNQAMDAKLETFAPMKLDANLANNADLQEILKKLGEKAGTSDIDVTGLLGLFLHSFEQNTDLEKAMLANMGAEKSRLTPEAASKLLFIVAAIVNVAQIMTTFADGVTGSVRGIVMLVLAGWGAIIGDLKLGHTEVFKTLDGHDVDLYLQIARKMEAAKTATGDEKTKLEGEIRNLGLLIQNSSLKTQRSFTDATKPWMHEATIADIDQKMEALKTQDTDGILPLHERYMQLTRELAGHENDAANKGKVDELLALEKQLADKGVNVLDYMDYVRRSMGVQITAAEGQDEYFNALRSDMSFADLQKVMTNAEGYMKTLEKNKERMAAFAASFVRHAAQILQNLGVDTKDIDLKSLDTLKGATEAFNTLKTKFAEYQKNAPSYDELLKKLEKSMEDYNDGVWQAYKQVKDNPGMSMDAARDLLLPHVKNMYDQLNTMAFWTGIPTLTIFTGDPVRELSYGLMTRFVRANSVKDMLNITAEAFGALHHNLGTGESAKDLVSMYRLQNATKDITTLGDAFQDYTKFTDQLNKEAELYSTLAERIGEKDATPRGKLRGHLDEYQSMLLTAYQSLEGFTAQQLSALTGDSSRVAASTAFEKYVLAVRPFLKNYSLQAINADMTTLLNKTDLSDADVAQFDKDHGAAMRAEYQHILQLKDNLPTVADTQEKAVAPLAREIYTKRVTFQNLHRSAAEGFSNTEKQGAEGYIAARDAYRKELLIVNGKMAAFYGYTPEQLNTLLTKPSLTPSEQSDLNKIFVLDEHAFDNRKDPETAMVPTDKTKLDALTREYQLMTQRATAYATLLDAMRTDAIVQKQGNRDNLMLDQLLRLGYITRDPRKEHTSASQHLAFNDAGVMRDDMISEKALTALDPQQKLGDLATRKHELAGLINTLVNLSGSRGNQPGPERYDTFASAFEHNMQTALPRYQNILRQREGAYKDDPNFPQAKVIDMYVNDNTIFEMTRNLHHVDNLPAGMKLINLGITGSGQDLVARVNDKRFYEGDSYINFEGTLLLVKFFVKENCMNLQIPPTSIVTVLNKLKTYVDLQKPGLMPQIPQPGMPNFEQKITLKEFNEVALAINRNELQLPYALLVLLGSIIPGLLPPTKPGEPITPKPPETPPAITPKPIEPITPHPTEGTTITSSTPSTPPSTPPATGPLGQIAKPTENITLRPAE